MPAIFVHVSDIHFGQEKGEQVHINADVKEQLIADAKEVVSGLPGGVAHGILVTGDIAQSGKRSEYDDAAIWLDKLAAAIGVEIHRVQMVPGNHDLDRSKLSFAGKQILDHIRAGGSAEYEAILANPTDRAALFARFEDYEGFSSGYSCALNVEGAFDSEMVVTLAPGRAIRFIRLNSSLLCHGEEDNENPELILGARQFTIPRTDGEENIVLVHHPLTWYKDQEVVRDYINSRARVFISGHEHHPKVSVESVSAGADLMMLAAGATVPFKSEGLYTYTYNIIEFDWDDEIDGLSVTIHPRAWNPRLTAFESDPARLGSKEPKFRLACPSFRRMKSRGDVLSEKYGVTVPREQSEPTPPVIDMKASEAGNQQVESMPLQNEDGYETARLRFFRDLLEGERLRILIELDALPRNFDEPMSHGLERKLFDMLVRSGKLEEVRTMIEAALEKQKDGGGNG